MSSWRDFLRDDAWSWLRVLPNSTLLHFEPFEGQQDLCELIVHPEWPTLVCLSLAAFLHLPPAD